MPHSLFTKRLEIRPLTSAERDAFVAYRRDPAIALYQTWTPSFSVEDADALIAAQPAAGLPEAGGWVQLALVASSAAGGHVLVGDVAIGVDAVQPQTYELGVTIAAEHHGAGYATEALGRVIDWLMIEHGAHRIVMQGDARNGAVLRLCERLQLRHEGSILDGDWFKGEWTTLERFALLRREWEARRS